MEFEEFINTEIKELRHPIHRRIHKEYMHAESQIENAKNMDPTYILQFMDSFKQKKEDLRAFYDNLDANVINLGKEFDSTKLARNINMKDNPETYTLHRIMYINEKLNDRLPQ